MIQALAPALGILFYFLGVRTLRDKRAVRIGYEIVMLEKWISNA